MSSQGSNALIQQLLVAEEQAEKIIKLARESEIFLIKKSSDRDKKIKEAKIAAEEEINIFKRKEEERFQREFEALYGAEDTSQADLEEVTLREIEAVKKDYKANKDVAIQFLTKRTTEIELCLDPVQKRYLQEKAAAGKHNKN